MAQMDELSLSERLLLKGYPFYRYARRPENLVSMAMTPLQKSLSDCTVALVTTAGLSLPDQPPFDTTIRMGDSSFREFPNDISPQVLEMHHRSGAFDQRGILRDRNLVLPLGRLREMLAQGVIGDIAPHHYSFMGSIIGPSKLMRESTPEVARRLVADNVDVVLLTPA